MAKKYLDLKDKLNELAQTDRFIKLYDVARDMGYNHIKQENVQGIMKSFLRKNPDYKAVQMVEKENSNMSLFCSLTFVDKEIEFENTVEI